MKTCIECRQKKHNRYFPSSYHRNSRGQQCGGKISTCGLCLHNRKLEEIRERKINRIKNKHL